MSLRKNIQRKVPLPPILAAVNSKSQTKFTQSRNFGSQSKQEPITKFGVSCNTRSQAKTAKSKQKLTKRPPIRIRQRVQQKSPPNSPEKEEKKAVEAPANDFWCWKDLQVAKIEKQLESMPKDKFCRFLRQVGKWISYEGQSQTEK